MGLFTKFKDILFEEEEVLEPTKSVKEEKKETPKSVPEKPISRQIQPEKLEPTPKPAPKPEPEPKKDEFDSVISERELFRSENTFPFPDFDEEEFDHSISRTKSKPTTNVLEYEKKKRAEKRTDFGRYEKTEIREIVEKKKFRPSPIISPVFGVLNEDYKIEDIKDKKDNYSDSLDIDSVRKKAFEPMLENLEPKSSYYEETVTVKVKEPEEEKQQKERTIDELLEGTSDVMINTDIDDDIPGVRSKKEYDEIDNELNELINHPKEREQSQEFEDDDTLENDLFDLIDSMYDNREDGDL